MAKKSKKKQYMQYIKTINAPTYAEITKIFNMEIKDIDKSIKELVDAGLIEVDGDVIHVYAPVRRKI